MHGSQRTHGIPLSAAQQAAKGPPRPLARSADGLGRASAGGARGGDGAGGGVVAENGRAPRGQARRRFAAPAEAGRVQGLGVAVHVGREAARRRLRNAVLPPGCGRRPGLLDTAPAGDSAARMRPAARLRGPATRLSQRGRT